MWITIVSWLLVLGAQIEADIRGMPGALSLLSADEADAKHHSAFITLCLMRYGSIIVMAMD